MPTRLDTLREKVLTDKNFRKQLKNDTKKALKSVGITPTRQNVALVRNVIDSIENLYDGFDEIDTFVT